MGMVNKCKIMKIGDKVKIIQRKSNNNSGVSPKCFERDGFVGEIGYVETIHSTYIRIFKTNEYGSSTYMGLFDTDDYELITDKPNYEIF